MSELSRVAPEAPDPSSLLVVQVGTLVDGTGSAPKRGVQIYVRDGRVVEIAPSGDVPLNARVLDFSDQSAVPGLIDCHVHLSFSAGVDPLADLLVEDDSALLLHAAANARTALTAGITTVRDLGDRGGVVRALRDGIARGIAAGPRILSAGSPITITGGHCHFLGLEADSKDDVRRVAREQIRDGVDCLKIMASGGRMTPGTNPKLPQYSVGQLRAAVGEARRAGLTIAAHALSALSIRRAAEAGVDTIEHCNWLDREEGLAFDESTAVLMAERGVAFDPTLTPVQSFLTFEPELLTDVQRAAIAIRVQVIEVFRRMLALGVTMVAGTDAGTRRSALDRLPGELELYVEQLGLTPVAAIATATGGAAEALGLSAEVGTVQPGRQADLTVVDGDPSVDIGVLKRARAVIQGGRLVAEHGRLLT
jgi:imidazolonepropionase-like amidohydrolase